MKKILILLSLIFLLPLSLQAISLGDLKQRIKDELAFDSSLFYPDSLIIRKINDACKDISCKGYAICKLDTIITVIDQAVYDLNNDIVPAVGVEAIYPDDLTNRCALVWIPSKLLNKEPYVFTGSKPLAYSYHGKKIRLSPIPLVIDTLIIEYYARDAVLSANADTTLLPEDYHNVIVFYTAGLLLARENAAKANWYLYLYNYWLNQAIQIRINKPYDIYAKPSVSGD